MIVSTWKDEDDVTFSCSVSYSLESERERIIKELKENVRVLKDACEVLNLDYLEFVCQEV